MKRRSISAIIYFLGILTGFGFYYLRTLCTFDKNVVYKDDIANMVIDIQENLRFKLLTVSKGSRPLIKLEIDKVERVIEKAAIYDENEDMIGRFYVTNGKFSGIEMLTDELSPFFQMEYDEKMRRWHQATYCKMTSSNKCISEFYEDTNIDGQFDVLTMFDKNGNCNGRAVYFNHAWDFDYSWGDDDLIADISVDGDPNESLKLVFDFKEGWIPESMQESTTDID